MYHDAIWISVFWSTSVLCSTATHSQCNISKTLPWYEMILFDQPLTVEREKLEEQYTDYFGLPDDKKTWENSVHSRYWGAVLSLDLHDNDLVRQICREAYNAISHPAVPSESSNPPEEMWPYDLYYAELLIGPKSESMTVVVLECTIPDTGTAIYLTKGRSNTSVYLVKPAKPRQDTVWRPNDVVLDEDYESDLELESDFLTLARSIWYAVRQNADKITSKKAEHERV